LSLTIDRIQAVPGVQFPWQSLPPAEIGTAQQEIPVAITFCQPDEKAMELSYAQLNLIEEALRQYFGNKASDWVCSTDEQVALTRDEVSALVEKVIARRAAASRFNSCLCL